MEFASTEREAVADFFMKDMHISFISREMQPVIGDARKGVNVRRFSSNIPVSDAYNVGYLNLYCALCNGVAMSDIVAWKVTVNCRNLLYPFKGIHKKNTARYTNNDSHKSNYYDKTLQILNVVGVSCSLLGLFLTFIIRCIKKDLRNISGKIVMNIAAALFLAQLGTLLAKTLVESKLGCVALAVLLHYLWLVAFMWMFIMSIVLFKSFRSLKSAVEHRSGKQSITIPFFCCWGLPVLVVAAAMTLHIWEYAPIKFFYGDETVCWIPDEFATFMFLGIPMATILALNSIMFVVIVCGIYQTKMSSKAMRGSSTKKDISTNLIIFAKVKKWNEMHYF
ncbi:adhesion G protein-coupled receptor E4-like [Anneissia japonica]|uniref:adhesion G protein-coupled receptor E4-like n=1 Tax=Anneissia japonica TaxID=1529436 RepID=UPI001425A6D9|nr:adhesion G protein-coupled receptor E4-like [Anneissia japonica]